MSVVAFDTETFFSTRNKYSIKTTLGETYTQHPLFDCYMVSVSDGKQSWSGHPRDFNWSALDGQTLLSHNSRFDMDVYDELVRQKIAPKLNFVAWHDTSGLTSYLCNRRSLAAASEYLLGIEMSKEVRNQANNKHWPNDFSADEQKAMLAYARTDALRTFELWNRFADKWPEMERRLSAMTVEQGRRGVCIDRTLLDDYIIKAHAMKASTEAQLPWLADSDDSWEDFLDEADMKSAKPTSTKCIAEQAKRSGIPCPPVIKDDPEGFEAWEDTYTSQHPWIPALSAWRSINKLYKTFLLVKERLRPDGTMPFSLKYFGAHTGRWSGDARINMQNQRKRPLLCNELGMLEMNERRLQPAYAQHDDAGSWPEWVKHDMDFRRLIIARPGKKLIISDLSQVEPRVLAWLSGDMAALKLMAEGLSPYESHMRTSMGWTGGKPDKNSEIYKLAKARVLALGYQAGYKKFITMSLLLAGIDVTAEDPEWIEQENALTGETKKTSGYGQNAKRIVKQFRDDSPLITGLWSRLDGAFKQSIGSDFQLRLPSGRVMNYDKIRAEYRTEKDEETGRPKLRTVFTAGIGGRRFMSYGGKLTENITQATARDVFGWQLVNLDKQGIPCLFSVHDEGVFEVEVDSDVKAVDIEREMSQTPPWMPGLTVAAEAKESQHYMK